MLKFTILYRVNCWTGVVPQQRKNFMSRRKRRKFRQQYAPSSQGVVSATPQQAVAQAVANPHPAVTPESSKQDSASAAVYSSHDKEYRQIQSDLIKVVIVNGALFALVFALYFLNQSNHFLDNLYNRFF